MKWRSSCAFVALIFVAQGAQAQSVGYEEALRAARVEQPVLQARELEVEALRNAAEAADELPDPRLRAGIVYLEQCTADLEAFRRARRTRCDCAASNRHELAQFILSLDGQRQSLLRISQ